MKQFFSTALLLLMLLGAATAQAQRTGSYDTAISFMGGSRAVSLHVPANYQPAKKYRLIIGLHGLGDTCSNYRNALVNSLGWAAGIPNTIFVCPEAQTRFSDFYDPAGGEAIIAQVRAMAMATYHIDTQNVVLQGFSLGGRAALRYGLDHHADFKGLLLNTPAVQGVKEALNGHPLTYSFNYSNASQIPVYMTLGATDITYVNALDTTYEQLVRNNAIVRYRVYPGLGHTIPAFAQMADAIPFFDTPAFAGKDVEAVKVYEAGWVCNSSQATPRLLLRSVGTDTITSIKYSYTLAGQTKTGTWTGRLLPFQHAIVPLSVTNASPGNNTVSVQIDSLNVTFKDTVVANNQRTQTFFLPATPVSSLNEGFEGAAFPPQGWDLQEAGDFYTAWADDNTIAKTGSKSATAFNTILIFDNAGRVEGLTSPPVDLGGITNPRLAFDVSYTYHRYTPPYFTADVDFADTLEVLVSTDCGANFTRVYKKGGADLITYSSPILNPLDMNSLFANPADSNWRREVVDLNSFKANGSPVFIKFNYISALGGAINLDNVSVSTAVAVANAGTTNRLRVYPNPAKDVITVVAGNQKLRKLELTDISGRSITATATAENAADSLSLNLQNISAGIYLLQVQTEAGIQTERISIVK